MSQLLSTSMTLTELVHGKTVDNEFTHLKSSLIAKSSGSNLFGFYLKKVLYSRVFFTGVFIFVYFSGLVVSCQNFKLPNMHMHLHM